MKLGRWVAATIVVLLAAVGISKTKAGEVKSILCDDMKAICKSQGVLELNPAETCKDGVVLKNITTCNCGFYCINPIEEKEKCFSRVYVDMPDEICGWGLECIDKTTGTGDRTCGKNLQKPCINASVQYETTGIFNPGELRPNCDGEGKYAGRQCTTGGTCYCVDKDGNRIFGEALAVDADNMNCECSRYWNEIDEDQLSSGMRCLTNGNFDALQCINNVCFCFDSDSQTLTSGPIPMNILIYLDCYNKSIHTSTYWQPCEKAYHKYMEAETQNFTTGARKPRCTVDGFYHQVQYVDTHAFCADKNGKQIENFTAPIYQSDDMDCNCAHHRKLLEDAKLSTKPHCCPNGNYFPWQTRGLLGYCVDNNGNQNGQAEALTNVENLHCYSKNPCAK
ncbi:uncharacterized protein LOC143041002 [Oratosquilla oratoria]|uniref:uncharacterized protein LOC143041002 n=1 Tax=Oratosquilla oratoria TaxID=337810 RepID=UPI003F757910